MTPERARQIAQGELSDWLSGDEERRLSHGAVAWEDADAWLHVHSADWREALAAGDWRSVLRPTESAAEAAGLWYPDGDPSLRMLAGELLKTRVRFANMVSDRQEGIIVETPPAPTVHKSPAPAAGGSRTLGKLIDDYRAARNAEHGELSTDRKYSHVFKALEEALGREQPISLITREDCRRVQETLRSLPAHVGKRYPGLSLTEAVAAGERDGAPKLAPNTVNAYIQNLAAVLNWAVDREWLDKNPARGLSKKAKATVKRRGLTTKELKALFGALAGERQRAPWRFWIPALALYTGARANELCQLRVDDVREEDGISFLSFSEFDSEGRRAAGKRLKTDASERRVPVPRALVTAGFLDFVVSVRRTGEARLFPDLRPGPDGSYSAQLSKWFARAMEAVGLSAPSLVFHSFRHGFRDACRRASIPEETAKALGGWALPGQAARYGEASMLTLLARESEKITFDGFQLPDPSLGTSAKKRNTPRSRIGRGPERGIAPKKAS